MVLPSVCSGTCGNLTHLPVERMGEGVPATQEVALDPYNVKHLELMTL